MIDMKIKRGYNGQKRCVPPARLQQGKRGTGFCHDWHNVRQPAAVVACLAVAWQLSSYMSAACAASLSRAAAVIRAIPELPVSATVFIYQVAGFLHLVPFLVIWAVDLIYQNVLLLVRNCMFLKSGALLSAGSMLSPFLIISLIPFFRLPPPPPLC